MARSGIYVNGKEIVARYVGDNLVWKKKVLTEIVELSLVTFSENEYGLSTVIHGEYTHLRQDTFYNVTLVIDGRTFSHVAKEVVLKDGNPIAIVKFESWTQHKDFIRLLRKFRRQSIRMFIKE